MLRLALLNSVMSVRIHKQRFRIIRGVAFMLGTPSDGHIISPVATVCIYLRVWANFINLHFQ